jgi:hypothetical protein
VAVAGFVVLNVLFFLRIVLSDFIQDLVLVAILRLDGGCEGQCRYGLLDSRHVEETGGLRGGKFDWLRGLYRLGSFRVGAGCSLFLDGALRLRLSFRFRCLGCGFHVGLCLNERVGQLKIRPGIADQLRTKSRLEVLYCSGDHDRDREGIVLVLLDLLRGNADAYLVVFDEGEGHQYHAVAQQWHKFLEHWILLG